jgi:hypothetical protein
MKVKHQLFATIVGLTLPIVSMALPARAENTRWGCYLNSNGELMGNVEIWWGHTSGDAGWACNQWISVCGNNGGCYGGAYEDRD